MEMHEKNTESVRVSRQAASIFDRLNSQGFFSGLSQQPLGNMIMKFQYRKH